ncbi:MAG TPA: hypothetical protein K8V61_08595 [Bacteroides clarus]|uniref:hypothetical protein n=1 Tax=Bacteroides clarus TaxID=626929 RepID=UPI001D9286D0|nr:hypothetical protein [Bacteroides clarus]HJF99332.1 hypothetical protein [Bacteroides clarus]
MLKIGELTSGLFAGDKLIAGKEFDLNKLYENLSFVPPATSTSGTRLCVCANFSSRMVTLFRGDERTDIESGKIDWYSAGENANANFKFVNSGSTIARIVRMYSYKVSGMNYYNLSVKNTTVRRGETIDSFIPNESDDLHYVLFVFDV